MTVLYLQYLTQLKTDPSLNSLIFTLENKRRGKHDKLDTQSFVLTLFRCVDFFQSQNFEARTPKVSC